MAGWTLVPESPQGAPSAPPDAAGAWTPVPETQARQRASQPQESAFGELLDMGKLGTSLVFSQMMGIHPTLAYEQKEHIEKQLHDVAGDFTARMSKAATVKDDPLYMLMKHKGPEPFESHDMLENFVHDVSELIGDPVVYGPMIAGTLLGSPRAGADAGFVLDAGLRKMLTDHYQKGDIKSFGELASRTASTLWEATKGLATGEAMHLAGGLPVPSVVGSLAPAVRGLYQASAMTVAGGLLNWQVPTLEQFTRNAVLVGGLGLITHAGSMVVVPDMKQAMMDVYTKDGTKPEETAIKLQAQPPVKPAQPEGLHPAIKLANGEVIHGNEGETHSDLAERITGERPVTIEQLEADPKLADKVLTNPAIQVQQVIDKAFELKDELDPSDERSANLKSGRGFAALDKRYLNREQAKRWVKSNEPETHEMWLDSQGGDNKAEFHSQDYQEARSRVAQRNIAEGAPQLSGVSQDLQEFLAKNREELNAVKASDKGASTYGETVLRSTLVGPRNMVRSQAEQVAGRIAKIIPDYVDQEALSFMRDYRDAPDELRAEIEDIRKGDNEKLKAAIPSMERALQPTPQMLEADKLMTDYFTQANQLRSAFTGGTTSIDPSRYSPRNFARVAEEDEQPSRVGSSKFSKRSPHDIRREYLRLLDPLKSGDVEARTFNSVDELRVYGDRLSTSVARNVFEMELKNTELGKHGIAGQVPPELRAQMADTGILSQKEIEELGGIPKNWVALPGTEKTIVSGGKQFRVGLQVPPTVAEAMKPILENDVLSGAKYWKAAKYAQAYIKSIELGLSPFHMRALTLSFLNNEGIDAYRKALTTSNDSPEFEAQERIAAVEGGVTTTKTSTPYEAYQGLKPSSIEPRDTLLAKAKAAYAPVDAIFKGMTKATFEVVQRKFKVIGYSIRKASWLANNPNATDVEYGKAMRSIGKEINAVYGGLNWDVMGVSANYQAVARMFLLAPDWTFSNVANLKYAFQGGPGGNAARAFWLKSFVTGFAMTQGMSLLITGQPSKQWDKVYLGKDDKGKEMYSSMFFVGAPKDAIGTVSSTIRDGFPIGTIEFAINKASPLVGTGLKLAEKTDWQGKPIIKRSDSFGEKSAKGLEFAGEQLLPAPFVIKDMAERIMNPGEDLTYKDFLAGLVGAQVYHEGKKEQQPKLQGSKGYSIRKRKLQ